MFREVTCFLWGPRHGTCKTSDDGVFCLVRSFEIYEDHATDKDRMEVVRLTQDSIESSSTDAIAGTTGSRVG